MTFDPFPWLLSHLLSVLGFLLAVILVARLMREHRPPGSAMAWLLSMVLIPYVGVPLYLILGRRKLTRRAHRPRLAVPPHSPSPDPDGKLEQGLASMGVPPATTGNRMVTLHGGEEAFRKLMELIDTASSSIDVGAFILGRDPVGRVIVEALARRAREGVCVRLLLDALGCWRTRGRFVRPLVQAGGRVAVFSPLFRPFRGWTTQLRNHRKIVIVDGAVAKIGGMNLAEEYMGPTPLERRWTDFAMLLEGPVVRELAAVFEQDWAAAVRS
ncbi:MAG: phospholipase D-like domain-containing protein, partial [Planctomycetota bacterium]